MSKMCTPSKPVGTGSPSHVDPAGAAVFHARTRMSS